MNHTGLVRVFQPSGILKSVEKLGQATNQHHDGVCSHSLDLAEGQNVW